MKRLVPFEKFEASGNDFIIFDFFEFDLFDLTDTQLIKQLCDRHFGIGADGVIALKNDSELDFSMKYFNSDGNPSSFCGNGSRASVLFMAMKQSKLEFGFNAMDGKHLGKCNGQSISVKMKDIDGYSETPHGMLIDTGSPHLMIEVDDPWNFEIVSEGRRLRNLFGAQGVNVNFVKNSGQNIRIATYERGVEWETLACGTGITASAYYFASKNKLSGHQLFKIEAKGGVLELSLNIHDQTADSIWLSGHARKVFSGFIEI